MKRILLTLALFASMNAFSQDKPPVEKPVPFTRLEVDSAKSVLTTVSQRVANIACLSQGDAAQLQQLFMILFNTITRKEKEATPAPVPPSGKPKN